MAQTSDVVGVTGASAGVGRAVVREFARRGCRIGLIARGAEGLEAAAPEVAELGSEPLILPCDVADAAAVENAAATVEERWGAIVQVGSALAYRSIPLQSAYCAAKHAIVGFTESVRSGLFHDRSRVHLTDVHLPAVNTPQFDLQRSKMPRRAQPVPPIYPPEVVARAIVWAAYHRRRSVWVGLPTVKAIFADKFIPGLLDRYLGRIGYARQMTDEEVLPGRPDSLMQPVPGDHGAHGRFESAAKRFSLQVWANLHRRWLTASAVALGVAAAMARRRALLGSG